MSIELKFLLMYIIGAILTIVYDCINGFFAEQIKDKTLCIFDIILDVVCDMFFWPFRVIFNFSFELGWKTGTILNKYFKN